MTNQIGQQSICQSHTSPESPFHLQPIPLDNMNDFVESKSGRQQQWSFVESYIIGGRSLYILGMPGIGKTSFLNYARQQTEKVKLISIAFVYVDLSIFFLRKDAESLSDYLAKSIKDVFASKYNIKLERNDLVDLFIEIYDKNTNLRHKPIHLVIAIDHIDRLSLDIINKCTLDKLKDLEESIQYLKFYAPTIGFSVLFCGRRHYTEARDIFIYDSLKAGDVFADSGVHDKIEQYRRILQMSRSKVDIYYLVGFNALEVQQLCDKIGVASDINLSNTIIDKICNSAIKLIGYHPQMLVIFLNALLLRLSSEQNLSHLEDTIADSISSCMTNLLPTFHSICESIWKYAIRENDKNIVCELSEPETCLSDIVETMYSNGKYGSKNRVRMKIELLESQGLICWEDVNLVEDRCHKHGKRPDSELTKDAQRDLDSLDEEQDSLQHRVFFSDLFRRIVSYEFCGGVPSAGTESASEMTDIDVSFTPDRVEVRKGGQSVELLGITAKLFTILYYQQSKIVTHAELVSKIFGETETSRENLNRLYQAKRLASDKLSSITGLDIKSLSGKGYKLEIGS